MTTPDSTRCQQPLILKPHNAQNGGTSREARAQSSRPNRGLGDNQSPNLECSREFIYQDFKSSNEQRMSFVSDYKNNPPVSLEMREQYKSSRPRSALMQTSRTKEFFQSMYNVIEEDSVVENRSLNLISSRLVKSQANLCADGKDLRTNIRPSMSPPPPPNRKLPPPPLPARNINTRLSSTNLSENSFNDKTRILNEQKKVPPQDYSRSRISSNNSSIVNGLTESVVHATSPIVFHKPEPRHTNIDELRRISFSGPSYAYSFGQSATQPLKIAHQIAPYAQNSFVNGNDHDLQNSDSFDSTYIYPDIKTHENPNHYNKFTQRSSNKLKNIHSPQNIQRSVKFSPVPNNILKKVNSRMNDGTDFNHGAKSLLNLNTIDEGRINHTTETEIRQPIHGQKLGHLSSAKSMGDLLSQSKSFKPSEI